mmetsp:Transcript_3024/g.5104  ORF Transcript_3024/g.5104 Transcript_3024/m.5104 type:complete len:93 (+) Transcript_3024:1164-1442(+)
MRLMLPREDSVYIVSVSRDNEIQLSSLTRMTVQATLKALIYDRGDLVGAKRMIQLYGLSDLDILLWKAERVRFADSTLVSALVARLKEQEQS